MERIEHRAAFGGWQDVYQHRSAVLNCEMKVAVYLPPQAATQKLPVLYWLSGLTCTEQNFITKAGAQRYAAEHGVILVAPDTSPRGDDVADAEGYDLGKGAGFYLNATEQPWAAHYRMHDYIVDELPALIEAHLPATGARSISGHSMGGHGALVIALRNPGRYRSVSAFSPIVAPTRVPWGQKAFGAYLGEDRSGWAGDEFLDSQLQPQWLQAACTAAGHPLQLRMQPGYDHSYYFIGTFIGEHIAYHAKALYA